MSSLAKVHIPAAFEPALPPHADPGFDTEGWLIGDDGVAVRRVWSRGLPVDGPWRSEAGDDVQVVADQFECGKICSEGDGAVRVMIGDRVYGPAEAAALAAALTAAVELADGWVKGQ
ncbi:hypothetical protein [Mycobacterium paraintracellulare]|uniref:hypothetical protein n=1 Tax=Mycobacterium paraintracellulare TaxID=1138383 RepID=UPI0019259912|nr:hypothetical protein [Mycobacterium paraintracellulare]BCP14835.1 hypothetical protein MINTM021_17440 [Mycobacterium paraintracellulare]